MDTRKTTPGWRVLEKYAVRVGGAHNHRMGLYDGVLIKDNHIAAFGGVAGSISHIRKHVSHLVKIEVEVSTLAQVEEALQAGVDVIMLDNMSLEDIKAAVALIQHAALVEVSGNVTQADSAGAGRYRCGYHLHRCPDAWGTVGRHQYANHIKIDEILLMDQLITRSFLYLINFYPAGKLISPHPLRCDWFAVDNLRLHQSAPCGCSNLNLCDYRNLRRGVQGIRSQPFVFRSPLKPAALGRGQRHWF